MLPVMARNLLESIRLLAERAALLADRCVAGIVADVSGAAQYAGGLAVDRHPAQPLPRLRRGRLGREAGARQGQTIREVVIDRGHVARRPGHRGAARRGARCPPHDPPLIRCGRDRTASSAVWPASAAKLGQGGGHGGGGGADLGDDHRQLQWAHGDDADARLQPGHSEHGGGHAVGAGLEFAAGDSPAGRRRPARQESPARPRRAPSGCREPVRYATWKAVQLGSTTGQRHALVPLGDGEVGGGAGLFGEPAQGRQRAVGEQRLCPPGELKHTGAEPEPVAVSRRRRPCASSGESSR